MDAGTHTTPSLKQKRIGQVISAVPALFLFVDGVMKLFQPAVVVEATVQLGYSAHVILPLGITLVVCTILYVMPHTSVLGAILLTGYLGGAVATHVRVDDSAFTILFPVIVGSLVWGGLFLRDARVRALIPLVTVQRQETDTRLASTKGAR